MPMILVSSPKEGLVYINTEHIVVLVQNAHNQGNSDIHMAFGAGIKTLVVKGRPSEIVAHISDTERRAAMRP